MISNPYYSAQLEQQVLCADPIELVSIMFNHLVASIMQAREHLLSGDRMARARSISKAIGIIGELARSLDVQKGGDFARNLRPIYAFVAERLVQAQTQQLEQPLLEAAETLRPLRDAWNELHNSRSTETSPGMYGEASAMNPEMHMESGMRFSVSA